MDPWCEYIENNTGTVNSDAELCFQDSFLSTSYESEPVLVNKNEYKISFPPPEKVVNCIPGTSSDTYLQRLELKLQALTHKSASNLSSKDILKSLKSRKEIFFENILSIDSLVESMNSDVGCFDYESGSNNSVDESFQQDIHRKLYPEHHAVSKVELLALLKHDALSHAIQTL